MSAAGPLAPPSDTQLLHQFVQHFQIPANQDSKRLLVAVGEAFSRLPYENLSKIVRYAEAGSTLSARESPKEIVLGHMRSGTGGTCFSLTSALLYLVRSLGFQAEPILADRSYGADTHCALLVWIDGQPHLVDPGFLIVSPIAVPAKEVRMATAFHELILRPQQGRDQVELLTSAAGHERCRLTFKTSPVSPGEFLRAWDASFDWDMMHYPVLTRVDGEKQIYVRGRFRQIRQRDKVERQEIPPAELVAQIQAQFGIDPSIILRALTLLEREKS